MTTNVTEAHATCSDPLRFLILALGNPILQDEGLGLQVLERLQTNYCWPDHVTLMDGGVMGLEILPYLETADSVLVIDAVSTGDPPGTLVRLEGEEIPAIMTLKMSVHQIGFQETLAMSKFRGTLPERLVLWGLVPERVELGVELSPLIAGRIDPLVDAVVDEIRRWDSEMTSHLKNRGCYTPKEMAIQI